jgi:hypothetical protein
MNDLTSYVKEYALILIPMLYVIGMILKGIDNIPDKYIPLLLLVVGVGGSVGLNGINMDSVIQGVLVTGVTVYANQLIVQSKKDDSIPTRGTNTNSPTTPVLGDTANNTIVTDSANSKMRVDNPENTVSEGNVVNITDTKNI